MFIFSHTVTAYISIQSAPSGTAVPLISLTDKKGQIASEVSFPVSDLAVSTFVITLLLHFNIYEVLFY